MDFPSLSGKNYELQKRYFSEVDPKPDLIFFQEATEKIASDLCEKIFNGYGTAYEKEDYNKCNCILYYITKINLNIVHSTRCHCHQGTCMYIGSRTSIVTLECKHFGNTGTRKIIVVSCHLYYHKLSRVKRIENAKLLFQALEELQQSSRCPVLVAGDFNCNLHEHCVERQEFELPTYRVTRHREACAGH